MFNSTGIVGVGLMGSSIALELKKRGLTRNIIGFDEDRASLEAAKSKGIVDEAAADLSEFDECDFAIVATPVFSIAPIVNRLGSIMRQDAIIIDVGSLKAAVLKQISLEKLNAAFVPVHPIAGIEKFGVHAARMGLFDGAYCIITPFDGLKDEAFDRVKVLIKRLGMRLEIMDPEEHDRVFAYISHLPHLIAYALVGLVEEKNNEKFKFIGGGFRDFTRIAASSERMWSEIFLMNKDNMLMAIREYKDHIERIEGFIAEGDLNRLADYLKMARLFKESLG